jgi:hypothetical protein
MQNCLYGFFLGLLCVTKHCIEVSLYLRCNLAQLFVVQISVYSLLYFGFITVWQKNVTLRTELAMNSIVRMLQYIGRRMYSQLYSVCVCVCVDGVRNAVHINKVAI